MRNPLGRVPGQNWTGDDDEDYEQSCMPTTTRPGKGDDNPGRPAFAACNYTCQVRICRTRAGMRRSSRGETACLPAPHRSLDA